jgi:phosphoglucomutase
MIAQKDGYTPTPAVSHAILIYNCGRTTGLADGIVIAPTHNPPADGGFKYNPPNGGPSEPEVTSWIEAKAIGYLESGLAGVKRFPFKRALHAATTHRNDYLNSYVGDLCNVIDMDAISASVAKRAPGPPLLALTAQFGRRIKMALFRLCWPRR